MMSRNSLRSPQKKRLHLHLMILNPKSLNQRLSPRSRTKIIQNQLRKLLKKPCPMWILPNQLLKFLKKTHRNQRYQSQLRRLLKKLRLMWTPPNQLLRLLKRPRQNRILQLRHRKSLKRSSKRSENLLLKKEKEPFPNEN